MSEQFEVQFQTQDGEWEAILRTDQGVVGRYDKIADAFILMGKEIECDPDMPHRIVRFVEEVVVSINPEEAK